ncbi:MAG: helix-turn-helix domain-containing protein [Oscillospiraceae bacterium]|nr:helix-turn-helix domain-containing protein [Oscillospiraceae bacterium]
MLSTALQQSTEQRKGYCVCLRDRIEDNRETEESLRGLIVVNQNINILELIAHVQNLFVRIGSWQESLRRCVYEHRSLQSMLALSEPIIGNFISISDYSMALLAYTRNIPIDDPVSVRLIKKGYHPVETTELLRSVGRADTRQEPDGLIITTNRDVSRYDLVSRIYYYHNTYHAQCVMTANVRSLSPGVLDLFRMLSEEINRYLDVARRHRSGVGTESSFLIELIENNITNEDVLADRASALNLPTAGYFRLFSVKAGVAGVMESNRLRTDLENLFPGSMVSIYQEQVLVLCFSNRPEIQDAPEETYETLEHYLSEADACCGASAGFTRIKDVDVAYLQAKAALKACGGEGAFLSLPSEALGHWPHVFPFESRTLAILASERAAEERLWRGNRAVKLLERLYAYDKAKGGSNVRLLYVYLQCESRAAKAGECLFMHRNNILYHVGHIADILKINLDTPGLKQELLDAYALLLQYGFREGEEGNSHVST